MAHRGSDSRNRLKSRVAAAELLSMKTLRHFLHFLLTGPVQL